MHITYDMTENILITKLDGELDHHSSAEARKDIDKTIDAFRCSCLILDFKNVTFMDSSGIGVVMGRYNKLKDSGGKVTVVHCDSYIDRILSMAGIYTIVPKYETIEEAIAVLKEEIAQQIKMKEAR